MTAFLLAIDQGTTGTTVVAIAPDTRVLGRATREFEQHFPKPGWVEHDLHQIWASVLSALDGLFSETGLKPSDCVGIGITNQRETTVLWERTSLAPVHRAIVWQDRRTADRCASLKEQGLEPLFGEKTGLVLDPYFSGTKLAWLLEHVDGAAVRAADGELAFGTIDTWLVAKLTGGAVHVTDASNASRTLLYDLHLGDFSEELCAALDVPRAVLPEVRSCSEVYGKTQGVPGLPDGIPIAGMAGDQQAALFGQACFAPGDAKCTYGTGAFLLMNTGTTPVHSQHGLLTTVAWRLGAETHFALEGSSFIAGAAVQWLRDGLGVLSTAAEIEAKAREVESAGDVVFVPALAGLGAPHWDPHARGLIAGLTRDTKLAHICRATLDGMAHQIVDLCEAMAKDSGEALTRLRVDGGATRNDLLLETQAGLLGVPVDRPENVETTALGAAYLAGLGVGVFDSLDAVREAHAIEHTFEPALDGEERNRLRARWADAVRRTRSATTTTSDED